LNINYRKTEHSSQKLGCSVFVQRKKVNNSIIKLAAVAGASATTNQMESGEEVRQSAMIATTLSKPGRDAARKGSKLFRQKIMAERKRKIKKVEAGKKLAKRGIKKTATNTTKIVVKETTKKTAKVVAKETTKVSVHLAGTVAGTAATVPAGRLIGVAAGKAVGWKMDKGDVKRTNRNRKIMFFMLKMNSKDDQVDSIGKMVKDLILKRGSLVIKKIVAVVLPALLAVFC